jgi:hypothetical protein
MEVGQLSKIIKIIGRQKVRIDGMIQTAAVQAIAQSIVFRNSTPAAQLFEAVGTSSRRDALVKYLEMFGNLCWSKSEKRMAFYDVEAVEHKPKLEWTSEYSAKVSEFVWHKAKAEPKAVSMYDVEEKVSTLIDSLRKSAKKGVELKHAPLLDAVEALYVKYVAATYDPTVLNSMKADQTVLDAAAEQQRVFDAKQALPVIEPGLALAA